MANPTQQQLGALCDELLAGSGDAIQWIRDVRSRSPRLDREADSLVTRLRRGRNLARRLGRAGRRPVSAGFFGLSQAGKSYLISALAAGENGELETVLDGERLNFISHVNPPGHGKEATGLVTRFTRQSQDAPPRFPIRLSLFSEVDLAKVLGNAFFNDFDREQVELNTDPDYIRGHLTALEAKRRLQPTGGVDEDGVVDLLDYFEQRFRASMQPLMGDYWPTAIELAPYLEPRDRASLFSVLWGEIDQLSEAYLRLCSALATVGFAEMVHCPIEALVARTEAGEWTQANSIMNVDILERLGRDDHDLVEVVPLADNEPQAAVALPRSLLAALTAELTFVLANRPVTEVLEQVDLLDFPGYRGRLKVSNLGEVRRALKDDQVDPVAQLVLRGKVAYLFERYTEDQEMNTLILCTPSHKQMDVQDLGPVLEHWIHSTQGVTAQERATRPPGLLWAITMFDFRLAPAPGQTIDTMQIGWEGLMKMALLERFGQYGWVHEWSPDHPFDNIFLVRKPRMATSVIETRGDQELGILPGQKARLDQLRTTFLQDPNVRKHISQPDMAWDAMLALNDGGVSRLAARLEEVAPLELKLARIGEQLKAIVNEAFGHRLGSYYRQEGAAEVDHKKRIAEAVINALRHRPDRFGELLYALQPASDHLRSLYLRAEEEPVKKRDDGEADRPDTGTSGLIDLNFGDFDLATSEGEKPAVSGSATRFVQAAMGDWISQLKGLPGQTNLARFLGVPRGALENLVDELITAADRLDLEGSLLAAIQEAEERTSATRARLVERQVFALRTRVCEFVDRLGYGETPPAERPPSPVAEGRRIFQAPPTIAPGGLPELAPRPVNFSGMYIVDWFEAFKRLTVANAGHDSGREISPEDNEWLGRILAHVKGVDGGVSLAKSR